MRQARPEVAQEGARGERARQGGPEGRWTDEEGAGEGRVCGRGGGCVGCGEEAAERVANKVDSRIRGEGDCECCYLREPEREGY